LIHKMDLLPEEQGEKVFRKREHELAEIALPMKVSCFKTSIWDETLYKAWSQIVYSLIPNIQILEDRLQKFCDICEADEVVIFEIATFLVISHASTRKHHDAHRFEKISNIIKQFKLGCNKMGTQFQTMEVMIFHLQISIALCNNTLFLKKVRNSNFSAFIDSLTSNACVMIIISDPNISMRNYIENKLNGNFIDFSFKASPAISVNINGAKKFFAPLLDEAS
jgi:Ras-related GTP-binding protein A/B